MHVALLAVAFALQTGGRGAAIPPSMGGGAGKPDPVVAAAMAAEMKFFARWYEGWSDSERQRAQALHQWSIGFPRGGSGVPGRYNPRQADLICYFDWDQDLVLVPAAAWGTDPTKRMIASKKNSRHWVCPNWYPPNDSITPTPELPDERLGIDGALQPERRREQYALRLQLIEAWQAYARRSPRDNFIAGQLVRLLVDEGTLDDALRAAVTCQADAWWCSALVGYVYQRRGETELADGAFAKSTRARSLSDACKWTDISLLLEGAAHSNYAAMNCAERDTVRDVIWWLADPLWSVPGNDRRVEQFAREVTIQLHAATNRDERYNWIPEGGGDALAEMIRRYGWPSYTYMGHARWPLRFGPKPAPTWGVDLLYQPKPKGPPIRTPDVIARELGGVNTTFEYSLGRLHLMPSWDMVMDPFAIKREDWTIRGRGGDWDESFKWWPQEHYAPLHPISDITDDQHAFLRRQDSTLIAFATNLSQVELARRVDDSVAAELLVSTGPGNTSVIGRDEVTAIDRVVFLAPVPAGPSLISAEVPWDSAGHYGARARFGIDAPASLSSMERGGFGISDPVLLLAPPDRPVLPNLADSAIALMRGSTTLPAGTGSLGVYWETYGFGARDSVDIAITIQRTTALNVLRSLGVIAGVAGNPNAPVSVSWKEPQRGHDTRTVNGAVPIQMRSVILNIGGLPSGEYTLEVSIRKPGTNGVKSSRDFVLR